MLLIDIISILIDPFIFIFLTVSFSFIFAKIMKRISFCIGFKDYNDEDM